MRATWTIRDHKPGNAGAIDTAKLCLSMARRDSMHPEIRKVAHKVIYTAPPNDAEAEAEAIFDFVRAGIRFTRDIYNVETVQSPRFTLRSQTGDCDDKATLSGALLLSIGYQVKMVLSKSNPAQPHRYTHIFPIVRLPRGWRAVETTSGLRKFGELPPNYGKAFVWG